jgi:hypothetical protein
VGIKAAVKAVAILTPTTGVANYVSRQVAGIIFVPGGGRLASGEDKKR